MTERDDEAWRAIVENYGERPALDEEPGPDESARAADAAATEDSEPVDDTPAAPAAQRGPVTGEPLDDEPAPGPTPAAERFVPPPAPPLPYVAPPRLAAGVGVFVPPLVLLVAVVFGISLPGWLGYLLVAGFVGGFAYLVAHMRKRPDDPWDDGARV